MLKIGFVLFFTFVNFTVTAFDEYSVYDIPSYQSNGTLSGNISTIGSNTLANLMAAWASVFKFFYPAVNVQIQTSGSTSAVTALLESTAQIGTMSRALYQREIDQFERKYGYPPQTVKIGMDVIALFVNQDNPLQSIDLATIENIYSRSPKCARPRNIVWWGELGLTKSWKNRRIQLFGRNSTSGTYDFFSQQLLCGGSYHSNVNALPSSASVVQAVSTSLNAIGYAGIGYQTAGVKMLPLNINGRIIPATLKNVISGVYPLSRYLYVFVNKKPNQPLPKNQMEFLKLMLSKQGQEQVIAKGFIPLPKATILRQRAALGLE